MDDQILSTAVSWLPLWAQHALAFMFSVVLVPVEE